MNLGDWIQSLLFAAGLRPTPAQTTIVSWVSCRDYSYSILSFRRISRTILCLQEVLHLIEGILSGIVIKRENFARPHWLCKLHSIKSTGAIFGDFLKSMFLCDDVYTGLERRNATCREIYVQ